MNHITFDSQIESKFKKKNTLDPPCTVKDWQVLYWLRGWGGQGRPEVLPLKPSFRTGRVYCLVGSSKSDEGLRVGVSSAWTTSSVGPLELSLATESVKDISCFCLTNNPPILQQQDALTGELPLSHTTCFCSSCQSYCLPNGSTMGIHTGMANHTLPPHGQLSLSQDWLHGENLASHCPSQISFSSSLAGEALFILTLLNYKMLIPELDKAMPTLPATTRRDWGQ
jgi:hypothetical protein